MIPALRLTVLPALLLLAITGSAQPVFKWAGRMGGTSISSAPSDVGRGIALDKSGNVYTTGNFYGNADFDPGPGTFTLNSSGASDVFVSKLSNNGSFIWAKKMGGSNYNDGNDIAVDDAGYIYITGSFLSATDFDPGPAVHTLTPTGYRDIFICKLDTGGNFVWARQFGGELAVTDQCDAYGIAVDAEGNVYTTGVILYGKADFDPGPGVHNLVTAGDMDMFISKLDSAGNIKWAHRIGSTRRDAGNKLAVDRQGFINVTGYFSGTVDFDPGTPVLNLSTSQFNKDMFIARFDTGGSLVWAHQVGVTNGDDIGQDIAVDEDGNIYTTGDFYYGGADFDPGPGTFTLASQSSTDIFICKWTANAGFCWVKGIGANSVTTNAYSIATAGSQVAVTGNFGGRLGWALDFDPGPGVYNMYSSSNSVNIFVLQLDTTGQFTCAGQLGGPTGIVTNTGFAIAADAQGNTYTTGQYVSTADFDPDSLTSYYLTTTNALDDEEIFVCKLQCGMALPEMPVAAFTASGTAFCNPSCISFTNQSTGSVSWLWSFPGGIPATDTSRHPLNICYPAPGVYPVSLIAYNSFGADTLTKSQYITSYVADTPVVSITGTDTVFCPGDSLQLCTTGTYSSYSWNTGDTTICTYAKAAGNYRVSTTDINGCTATSANRQVLVYPSPTVSIALNADTFSSSGAGAYQWYLNNTAITGATGPLHIAQQTGYYSVQVTDSNGCTALSNQVYFLITSLPFAGQQYISISGNPATGGGWLVNSLNSLWGSRAEIFNESGRLVYQCIINAQPYTLQAALPAGLYLLRITGPAASSTHKLVKY